MKNEEDVEKVKVKKILEICEATTETQTGGESPNIPYWEGLSESGGETVLLMKAFHHDVAGTS